MATFKIVSEFIKHEFIEEFKFLLVSKPKWTFFIMVSIILQKTLLQVSFQGLRLGGD